MEALVPAFVAALLAGIDDRPAHLAARSGFTGAFAGVLIGHGAGIAVAGAGALMIAPLLTPNARALLLGVALILAGLNGLRRRKPAAPSGDTTMLNAAATGFVSGDTTAFLAFALGTMAAAPVLAGAGALAGAVMLATAAASLAHDWQRLPLPLLGRLAGGVLILAGLAVMLSGLRLI